MSNLRRFTAETRRRRRELAVAIGLVICAALLCLPSFVFADAPAPELLKLLPANVGQFRQNQSAKPLSKLSTEDGILNSNILSDSPDEAGKAPVIGGEATYTGQKGQSFFVEALQTSGDSDAYSVLSLMAKHLRDAGT